MNHPRRQSRLDRRLAFERCEERLALSGDGGFIDLDAGHNLSPAATDFVQIPVSVIAGSFHLPNLNDAFSFDQASHEGAISWAVGVPPQIRGLGLGALDGTGEAFLPPLTNGQSVLPIAEPNYEPPSFAPPEGKSAESKQQKLVQLINPIEELPGKSEPDGSSKEDKALMENSGSPSFLPIASREALKISGRRIRERPAQYSGADSVPASEGGPIEVAQLVADTERAHEVRVLAAIALRLDSQQALLELPSPVSTETPPSELARSVVFEMAGFEPAAEAARLNDSHAPSAALPAAPVGHLAALPPTKVMDAAETTPSRALAFAQWPLFFSATLGLVLAGQRRRPQPDATQQPPRRNRQPVVS